MTGAFELQVGRHGAQPRIYPMTSLAGDQAFRRAESVWGGPLPGRVKFLQDPPLRVEFWGAAPRELQQAVGLSGHGDAAADYWSLYVEERLAGIYHKAFLAMALPALPAGLALDNEEGGIRVMYDLEREKIVEARLYVTEVISGAVARHWPDLAPLRPAAPGRHTLYGLDFQRDLQVTNIERYDYAVGKTSRVHREMIERTGSVHRRWLG